MCQLPAPHGRPPTNSPPLPTRPKEHSRFAADGPGKEKYAADKYREASLLEVIKLLVPVIRPGSHVLLISDFHDLDDSCRSSLLELSMSHHLHAVQVIDRSELRLPACGSLLVSSGQDSTVRINSMNKTLSSEYKAIAAGFFDSKRELFKSLAIPCKTLMTDADRIELVTRS